jgi:hypothetical protein
MTQAYACEPKVIRDKKQTPQLCGLRGLSLNQEEVLLLGGSGCSGSWNLNEATGGHVIDVAINRNARRH